MPYVKIILYEKIIDRKAPRHLHFKICVQQSDWNKIFKPHFTPSNDISFADQHIYGMDWEIKEQLSQLIENGSEISLVHTHHIQLILNGINELINENPDGEIYDHWRQMCTDDTVFILANLEGMTD